MEKFLFMEKINEKKYISKKLRINGIKYVFYR